MTGGPSAVEVVTTDAAGVTERDQGVAQLQGLHRDELPSVRSVRITIRADRDAWNVKAKEAPSAAQVPPIPREEVSISVSQFGTSLEVEGDDRTEVQGLTQRLVHVLRRGATKSPGFDRDVFFLVFVALTVALAAAFLAASHSLRLATVNNRWEPAEILAIVLGVGLGIAGSVLGWWLFPPVELFDEGQAGRFRRLRVRVAATGGTVLLALLAAYVYGWLHPR